MIFDERLHIISYINNNIRIKIYITYINNVIYKIFCMYDIYFYACNIIHIYTYIYIYYFCFLCEINEYNICILMTYFREYTYDYFTTSGLHAEI